MATEALLELPSPPTCILYPDDFACFGGLNVMLRRGIRVPEDISVAGYDGLRIGRHVQPRLTTLMPVSYTHLGHVKKLEECGILKVTGESGGHGNLKKCSVCLDKILIDLEEEKKPGNSYEVSLKAVSYTHLDVYKRQADEREENAGPKEHGKCIAQDLFRTLQISLSTGDGA